MPEPPGPALAIELDATGVNVAGTRVDAEVLALRAALSQHRGTARTANVRLQPDLKGPALARLLQAAAGTELLSVALNDGNLSVEVAVALPQHEPDCTLTILTTDPASPQPERRFKVSCPARRGTHVAQDAFLVPGNAESELAFRKLLEAGCTRRPCVLRVALAADTEHADILQVLTAYQRASSGMSGLSLYFRPRGAGATTVSGRLPPEVIQRIVREHFKVFRKCYEQGLARDPNLQGLVRVRFVIGRDGKVSNVTMEEESDLPDEAVRACVLKAFYDIKFPEPEGGIVTVVYPIRLAPG